MLLSYKEQFYKLKKPINSACIKDNLGYALENCLLLLLIR